MLVPILITLGFYYFFYMMCKLFVTRKERIAIINKISPDLPGEAFSNLYFGGKLAFTRSTALNIGCLLIGVGLGVALACVIDIWVTQSAVQLENRVREALNILYPALSALLGGVGLVVSYYIERKNKKSSEL